MSTAVHTATALMSVNMSLYAGDPALLKERRYDDRVDALLHSQRADQLTVRVAVHAQLRQAFFDPGVQKRLSDYLESADELHTLLQDAKARAEFFSRTQQRLQQAILESEEQKKLKSAHGVLAAWERANAVLLRHPMFMTYVPSRALLLESAATVALYRQYAHLEEGQYTSESSDGEVPETLKRMGGKVYFTQASQPFDVDEHNKMFSQQVLQNKRVEYEQLRETVTQLRQALTDSATLRRLESFLGLRNDIYAEFGIDRLVSLCHRKDRELGEVPEGGLDATALQNVPQDDTNNNNGGDFFALSRRVAQYALPKMAEACYRNYLHILAMDDWDAMMTNTKREARDIIETLRPLKDRETFLYWFLSCLTADSPQHGPNKLVGKGATVLEDYKKFWYPQKSSYVPSLNTAHRTTFATKVAEKLGLPHLLILSPVTYHYRENNDPNMIKTGTLDLMVYDKTNEKVLLIIANSSDERRPRGAFLDAQEERYRLAAVLRSVITNENELHGFTCSGTVAEYFFDPEQGREENFYCIMAPLKVSQKTPMEVNVPVTAFRLFTACPPRYYILGSNWGASAGTLRNPFPASYAHVELNELAIALSTTLPDDLVAKAVLPQLLTREEGLHKLEEEAKQKRAEEEEQRKQQTLMSSSARGSLWTPRTGRSTILSTATPTRALSARKGSIELGGIEAAVAAAERQLQQGHAEDEDPLSPVVPDNALDAVREYLLQHRRAWPRAPFLLSRQHDETIAKFAAVRDGVLRSPFAVFEELMRERHGTDVTAAVTVPQSPRATATTSQSTTSYSGKTVERENTAKRVAW